MTIQQKTVKKIEAILSEAEERRLWGSIELEIRNGKPTLVRQTTQIKLTDEENPDVKPRQE